MSLPLAFRFGHPGAFTTLLASALACFSSLSARADLIYVTLANNKVVTYDGSLPTNTDVEASEQTLVNTDVTNLPSPYGIARDSAGNIYVANFTDNFISKFNSSGVYQSQITTAGGAGPFGLAFNAAGDLWVSNVSNSTLTRYDSAGSLQQTVTDASLQSPTGIAINAAGDIYAANNSVNTISRFSSAGVFQSTIDGTGGQLNQPYGLAIDTNSPPSSYFLNGIYATNMGNNSFAIYDDFGWAGTSFGFVDGPIAIGIGGALVGWGILRFLVSVTGWVAAFVGAIIGAMALIWLWQKYVSK